MKRSTFLKLNVSSHVGSSCLFINKECFCTGKGFLPTGMLLSKVDGEDVMPLHVLGYLEISTHQDYAFK